MLLRVRRARLEMGLGLHEAAVRVNLAPQSLGRVETGRELPWPALRERLADLYGIPERDLFADIDATQLYLRQIAGKVAP